MAGHHLPTEPDAKHLDSVCSSSPTQTSWRVATVLFLFSAWKTEAQGRGGAMMQAQAGGHEPAGVTLGKSLDLSFLNSKMNIDSPVSTTGP